MTPAIDELTQVSAAFARQLLDRMPEFERHCAVETLAGVEGRHLLVRIPSPAGPDRDITIWMCGGTEPSLSFGKDGWHTHNTHFRELREDVWEEESLLDLLEAILRDDVVLCRDLGGDVARDWCVLDLRNPDAIEVELTDPYGTSERIRLMSFSGKTDQTISRKPDA